MYKNDKWRRKNERMTELEAKERFNFAKTYKRIEELRFIEG